MNKTYIVIIVAVVLVALLATLAIRSRRISTSKIADITIEVIGQIDGYARAAAYAEKTGGRIVAILGTGSMQPYIPASIPGLDPMKTTVGYAVTEPGATYELITAGDLCLYSPTFDSKGCYLHVAVLLDALGWVMDGVHNPRSESWARVTRSNFVGIAAKVFVWKQAK